jgi:molybdopterin molybdotransferase
MVEVKEALELIADHTPRLEPVEMDLAKACSYVLAQDVKATINMPPFDQSAMDGYAIADDGETESYTVIGEIPAGTSASQLHVKAGEAYRIFTGSMIPKNCKRVIQQELVEKNGKSIRISEYKEGTNIRPEGEQFKIDDTLAKKGDILNPGVIGFLASSGVERVFVFRKPRIHILLTGSELTKPGLKLDPGKIYESNGSMLRSAIEQIGLETTIDRVKDNLFETTKAVQNGLEFADILIISGGISVGDHDHVKTSLERNDITEIFYNVSQKPGKPLYFGKRSDQLVFGLPGNPSSALTCFYFYVIPAIQRMMNREKALLSTQVVSLDHDYLKKGSFTNFLRARIENGQAKVLDHQSSAMLNAWAEANALLIVPAEKNSCRIGEKFEALRIDHFYLI